MRLHILSDIHFDVRRSTWSAFAKQIPSDVGDVLVLAGDVLCMADVAAREMLLSLRSKAKDVVYVLGNHEHYHGVFDVTKEIATDVCAELGVHLLDAGTVSIGGRRFLGGTLWFRRDEDARRNRHQMMDFQLIEEFEDAVYRENARDLEFLGREIQPGDVVVTHHLPAWGSVAAEFRSGPRSTLNPFFLCDCEDMIQRRSPLLWVHGHTHIPCDYSLHETRVVCNPVGYPLDSGEARLDFFVDV